MISCMTNARPMVYRQGGDDVTEKVIRYPFVSEQRVLYHNAISAAAHLPFGASSEARTGYQLLPCAVLGR